MPNILVTGGAGFIGANFVAHWRRHHPADHVVVLDALTYGGNPARIEAAAAAAGFTFVRGDICSEPLVERLLREYEISWIVHFAAESHVDRSIAAPDLFLTTNVLGTHSLLKTARRVWAGVGRSMSDRRFHHISTDEVYGSLRPDDAAFSETTRYAPSSPYAASKAASDHLVRAYHCTYGVPVTTTNCSNNYGPYQLPEKLIPLVIVNILQGKPVPVYGDGLNIRDWLYVEDHCRAVEQVLIHGRLGETYNVGGRNEWRNVDLVRLICGLLDDRFAGDTSLGRRFPSAPGARGRPAGELIAFVADRPGHDRRYAVDPAKIERELSFCPLESLETGLRKTVEWYLANEPWWRGAMEGASVGGSMSRTGSDAGR